jgi:hypothetical protein
LAPGSSRFLPSLKASMRMGRGSRRSCLARSVAGGRPKDRRGRRRGQAGATAAPRGDSLSLTRADAYPVISAAWPRRGGKAATELLRRLKRTMGASRSWSGCPAPTPWWMPRARSRGWRRRGGCGSSFGSARFRRQSRAVAGRRHMRFADDRGNRVRAPVGPSPAKAINARESQDCGRRTWVSCALSRWRRRGRWPRSARQRASPGSRSARR